IVRARAIRHLPRKLSLLFLPFHLCRKYYRYCASHPALTEEVFVTFSAIACLPEILPLGREPSCTCRGSYRYFFSHSIFAGNIIVMAQAILHLSRKRGSALDAILESANIC